MTVISTKKLFKRFRLNFYLLKIKVKHAAWCYYSEKLKIKCPFYLLNAENIKNTGNFNSLAFF